MALFFSPLNVGFYDEEIHEVLPEDAIEISAELRQDLLTAQSEGKQIVAGDGGLPQAVEPEPLPPQVPASVTMRQAQLALLAHGYLDDVEAAIEAAGRAAQIEWSAAKDVYRDSPLALTMAGILGLDDDALDALFIEASEL